MSDAIEAKERKIPLILIGIGAALLLLGAYRAAGNGGVGAVIPAIAMNLVARIIILVIAAFVTAKAIGVSFGDMTGAIVKFAAIAILPGALELAIHISFVGWAVGVITYLSLLVYLFDLELKEALIFTGIVIVLNLVANFVLVGAMLSARN